MAGAHISSRTIMGLNAHIKTSYLVIVRVHHVGGIEFLQSQCVEWWEARIGLPCAAAPVDGGKSCRVGLLGKWLRGSLCSRVLRKFWLLLVYASLGASAGINVRCVGISAYYRFRRVGRLVQSSEPMFDVPSATSHVSSWAQHLKSEVTTWFRGFSLPIERYQDVHVTRSFSLDWG